MRSIALVLALLFTSGTVYAESARWLEDYIETNPSRRLVKTTPDPKVSKTSKAKPAKVAKKTKAKAAAKKAKRSKAKRGRRR